MLLYFIRHGDPVYDPDSLTPLGRRQAEAIAKRLAVHGIDRVFSSSSERAKQTAQPTCELLHKELTVLDWCHENHAWAELTVQEGGRGKNWAFCDPEYRRILLSRSMTALGDDWPSHPAFAKYPGFAAGNERIRRETYAFLAQLGYVYDEESGLYRAEHPNAERVALFAHEGFGLAFLSRVLGIPYPAFSARFRIGHTGMTVLHFFENEPLTMPELLMLANDGHIYKDGLPTSYKNYIYI